MVDRNSSDAHVWVEERLSAFIDNQLAQNERARVASHLTDCARCRASLDSLRWTVSLVKQAPAPLLPRSFTLPVTRKESKVVGFSFAFLRNATAIAILLLCLVVGLDVFSQSRFGAAQAPSAPAPAAQFAAPTQNIALAPTSAPASAPTSAPAATQPPPQGLSQPVALSTPTRVLNAGAAEMQATRAQADSALKSSATVPAAPPAPRSAITVTVALPSPTLTQPAPTQTVLSATSTLESVARTQPTRETLPSSADTAREEFSVVRMLELGLLGLALLLGIAAFIVRQRK